MVPRSVTGEIVSLRRSLLASQVEGFVVELTPNEGDAVTKGEVIARLDQTIAELEVTRAQADLDAAKGVVMEREAALDRYRRDLERTRQVVERGSATASSFDAAEADVRTTEALLMQARALVLAEEARLSLAARRLEDKTIRAPFDGRVVRKETELGEWVTPGDTIVEIVSLTELEARIDVPEHLVGYLTEDLGSIPLTIPGLGVAADTTARVIAVIPQGDSLSRMFPVRLVGRGGPRGLAAAPGRRLRPGMSVTASVPTGSVEPVLTIHKDAVLRDDAGLFAFMAVPFGEPGNPAVTGQAVPARISPALRLGRPRRDPPRADPPRLVAAGRGQRAGLPDPAAGGAGPARGLAVRRRGRAGRSRQRGGELMDIVGFSIRKPVTVTVGVILIVMFGLIGLTGDPDPAHAHRRPPDHHRRDGLARAEPAGDRRRDRQEAGGGAQERRQPEADDLDLEPGHARRCSSSSTSGRASPGRGRRSPTRSGRCPITPRGRGAQDHRRGRVERERDRVDHHRPRPRGRAVPRASTSRTSTTRSTRRSSPSSSGSRAWRRSTSTAGASARPASMSTTSSSRSAGSTMSSWSTRCGARTGTSRRARSPRASATTASA
jgi:membrane fusion protein (multidrug efflux system)